MGSTPRYAETLRKDDVIRRPGIDQVIHVMSDPEHDANGVWFTAGMNTQTPGMQFIRVGWHRHTLVIDH